MYDIKKCAHGYFFGGSSFSAGACTSCSHLACAHGHAWYGRCVKVRACRCLHELLALRHAGTCTSCSHFDAPQRLRVRQSRARLRYFKGSRVCRHDILSKEPRALPLLVPELDLT